MVRNQWGIDPGEILAAEAAGQREVVTTDRMPVKAPWPELAELGFVRGKQIDDLFTHATLPKGWSREGSDHSMWSYITDERGIRRVAIFYKAAFYDRDAFAHFSNPGAEAANESIYGDGPVAIPEHWDVFTKEERATYRGHLAEYGKDGYGSDSRRDRAARALGLVTPA
jgi:hypothetical protein